MSDQRPPSDKAEKIVVRLPDGMRDRLAAVAKENKRSVNAEVVDRLTWSFEDYGGLSEIGFTALIRRLEAHAEATETVAHRLFYELSLANGVGIERDDRITKALDAYMTAEQRGENRGRMVREIVAGFLRNKGFLDDEA